MKPVVYTAAHSGFALDRVPLGGAATVCHHLVEEWQKTHPFEFQVLNPQILGPAAPRDKDLVRYNEWAYARFCRRFERVITETILKTDPRTTVVLSNDVSEGPDFRALAQRGYSIYTIYHVDVVDYFTRIYLRGWVKPETATRWYRRLSRFFHSHGLLGLVFQKQQDSVMCSKGLIVPSAPMRDILLHCYPAIDAAKIHVLPWGICQEPVDPKAVNQAVAALRQQHHIPEEAFVVMTLSRISPEKGQDRLLKALEIWERRADYPQEGLWVFMVGEAAYMKGHRFENTLRRLAARLRKTRVVFPGYAAGVEKQGLFRLADLYVFPSRHESYGLTLLEAMQAGLPALACDDYGSKDILRPEFGELLPAAEEARIPVLLADALGRLLSDRPRLRAMGAAAKTYAVNQKFSDTAACLAQILMS